jgi:hypothetical protein
MSATNIIDTALLGALIRYTDGSPKPPARFRDYAPKDAALHSIADRLQAIQRRNFYQLAAEVTDSPSILVIWPTRPFRIF